MMVKRKITTVNGLLLTAVFLLWPQAAFAVQGHGGAEGLVSHQIAHGLFFSGIGYLLYKIHSARFKDPGWFEFKAFLWLLACWNLLTFSGHWMREFVAQNKFHKIDGHVVSMTIDGAWDAFFYLTRLDHLLLVPSFLLLLVALRKWRNQP